jgi:DedD protein
VPASSEAGAPAPVRDKAVAAEDSVDKGEEIVDTPPPKAAALAVPPAPAARTVPKAEPKAEPKTDSKVEHKAEHKPEHKEAKPEHKDIPKPEHKADTKLADKPAKPKAEDKPVKPAHEDARALAILEGKPAEKADKAEKERPAESGSQKVTLQVAAMSSQEKATELQARLRGAGISSHTEKFGELIRVKVGPVSKDEADRVRAKLAKLGL